MENVRGVAIEVAVSAVERLTGDAPDMPTVEKAVDNVVGKA